MRAYPRLKRRGFTARNYIAHFWNRKSALTIAIRSKDSPFGVQEK